MNQGELLRKLSMPKLKKKFIAGKLNQAINLISYGLFVYKYNRNGKKIQRVYYIFEDDNEYL